jgi:hypothetical protein
VSIPLIGYARCALSTPKTEVAKENWDLTVFGHHGTSVVHWHQPELAA